MKEISNFIIDTQYIIIVYLKYYIHKSKIIMRVFIYPIFII